MLLAFWVHFWGIALPTEPALERVLTWWLLNHLLSCYLFCSKGQYQVRRPYSVPDKISKLILDMSETELRYLFSESLGHTKVCDLAEPSKRQQINVYSPQFVNRSAIDKLKTGNLRGPPPGIWNRTHVIQLLPEYVFTLIGVSSEMTLSGSLKPFKRHLLVCGLLNTDNYFQKRFSILSICYHTYQLIQFSVLAILL